MSDLNDLAESGHSIVPLDFVGLCTECPTMALSRTVRAMGPTRSSEVASGNTLWWQMRPHVP